MKLIVMGSGRMGTTVGKLLAQNGHTVAIIDHDGNAAERLGNFKGEIVFGLGFDRATLIKAGIEQADAFIAASSSDNANIVAARIARQIFKVPNVIARIYDPRRAGIYQRLGIKTISSTDMGAHRVLEMIAHADLDVLINFGKGEVSAIAIEIPHHLVGRTVRDLSIPGELSVIAITRDNQAFIPVSGTEFRESDLIHLSVLSSAMDRIEAMFGLERR
jgi:trk system potassium uptake protein TrkA